MSELEACFECGTTVSVNDACETCKAPLCETCAFIGLGSCTAHRCPDIGGDIRWPHYHRKSYDLSPTARLRREG